MKTYTTPAIVLSNDVATETKSVDALMSKTVGIPESQNMLRKIS
jgi:hypothetical protein